MTDPRELFDLYDAAGNALGRVKAREEVHRDGDWHRSAHIWVFTSERRLLFQRRSRTKDTWPGRLDASVGGHYHAGEDVVGVVREAHEELGLDVELDGLVLLGMRHVESVEPGIVDREIQDIYLLRRDVPLTAYHPDPLEIDGLALLDAHEAAELHAGTRDVVEGDLLPRDTGSVQRHLFTQRDVIPGRSAYLSALAQAIDDLLAGQAPRGL